MWRRTFGVPAPPAWPLAVGFTVFLGIAAARAADPAPLRPGICLAALALAAALCSRRVPVATAVALGSVGWLFDNGFVQHDLGQLRWRTGADLPALALLLLCAVSSALLSAPSRRVSAQRGRSRTASTLEVPRG